MTDEGCCGAWDMCAECQPLTFSYEGIERDWNGTGCFVEVVWVVWVDGPLMEHRELVSVHYDARNARVDADCRQASHDRDVGARAPELETVTERGRPESP